jgi:hypothetical protein
MNIVRKEFTWINRKKYLTSNLRDAKTTGAKALFAFCINFLGVHIRGVRAPAVPRTSLFLNNNQSLLWNILPPDAGSESSFIN